MNTPELRQKLITLIHDASDEQLDVALSILDKRHLNYSQADIDEFKEISKEFEAGSHAGFSYEEVKQNALKKIGRNEI